MGHIRIGRLPKIRKWKQVINLLNSVESTSSEIAAATAIAAKEFFSEKKADPALTFAYWLLTQITYRARSDDYVGELKKINLDISNVNNVFEFLSQIARFANAKVKIKGGTFPISEFAQLSLREVLTETVGQQSQSLFGTKLEDIKIACRRYSSPNQFSKLARIYFTKVFKRTLQFFISKESPNEVGSGRKFEDISGLSDFDIALETYCYQSAKIVEEFAEGWYSKRNWQGEISEQDAKGFVAVAIEKIRNEIALEEGDTKLNK
jgi:hypothetical protein